MTNAGDEPDARLTDPSVDRSLTGLEALSDQWAVEVKLPDMVRAVVSPMRLNKNVPDDIRESFIHRMERQIDALIKQAWIEGAYRGCTGAFDAVRAGYEPRLTDGEESGK